MIGNDAWRAQRKQELDMGPGEPNVTELRELEKAEIRDRTFHAGQFYGRDWDSQAQGFKGLRKVTWKRSSNSLLLTSGSQISLVYKPQRPSHIRNHTPSERQIGVILDRSL